MLNGRDGIPVWLTVPVYRYGCPYRYTRLFSDGTSESAEVPYRDQTFSHQHSGAHEIKYTLVPNTKGESDLLKHFSLRKRKTYGRIDAGAAVCNFIVNSENPLSNFREARQTRQRIGKRHHPLLMLFFFFFLVCCLSFCIFWGWWWGCLGMGGGFFLLVL